MTCVVGTTYAYSSSDIINTSVIDKYRISYPKCKKTPHPTSQEIKYLQSRLSVPLNVIISVSSMLDPLGTSYKLPVFQLFLHSIKRHSRCIPVGIFFFPSKRSAVSHPLTTLPFPRVGHPFAL